MGNQVDKAIKSANFVIEHIKNSFTFFDAELAKLLYLSLVRPHLEYAKSVWNPNLLKNIEYAQRRATRFVPKLKKDTHYISKYNVHSTTFLELLLLYQFYSKNTLFPHADKTKQNFAVAKCLYERKDNDFLLLKNKRKYWTRIGFFVFPFM